MLKNKKAVTSISTMIITAITIVLCISALIGIVLLKKDEGIIAYGKFAPCYMIESQLNFLSSQGVALDDALLQVKDAKKIDEEHVFISIQNEKNEQIQYTAYIPKPDYALLLEKNNVSKEKIQEYLSSNLNLKDVFYSLKGW